MVILQSIFLASLLNACQCQEEFKREFPFALNLVITLPDVKRWSNKKNLLFTYSCTPDALRNLFYASKSVFPWNIRPSGLRLYLVAIYWHFPICRNTTIFIDIRYGSLAINCNSKYLAVFSFVISCQIIWNYFLYLLTKREVVHKRSGAVFAESFNKYSLANGTSNYRHGVGKVKHHGEILPQFCLDFF